MKTQTFAVSPSPAPRFVGCLSLPRLQAWLLAFLVAGVLSLAAQAQSLTKSLFLLTNSNQIQTATQDTLGLLGPALSITGITAGETLVGIDVRPVNQELYGLGVNATADTATLYHIAPQTGVATVVGTAGSIAFTTNGTTVVDLPDPATTDYDIDFNPTADRLRVVTATGLNFRVNPNTGVPIDGGVATGTNPDAAINGGTTTVNAVAYTNNSPLANVTTLYTIDAATETLYIQNPANNGTQTNGLAIKLNNSPIGITHVLGFDIAPGVNASANNAAVTTGTGLTILKTASSTYLYEIDLATGALTFVDQPSNIRSFAIQSRQPMSIGLDSTRGFLVKFSPLAPGTTFTVALSGIVAGEVMMGLDYRPATGQLYGLGINATTGQEKGSLYLIDPNSGAATVVGSSGQIAFVDASAAVVDLPTANAGWDIDFNPTADRLRVVTGTGLNFRVNPVTGAPVDGDAFTSGINMDVAQNNLPVSSTGVSGTAYTNNFAGATATTQYTLDDVSNSLFIQNPPNNGTQSNQITVTSGSSTLDFGKPVGFDIPASVTTSTSNTAVSSGDGWFTATVGSSTVLYSLNLVNGVATNMGAIPGAGLSSFAINYVTSAPSIINIGVTTLQPTSAMLNGMVTDDGGEDITERGFVFAPTTVNSSPFISGTGVTKLVAGGTRGGMFASAFGLTTGTNYTYRAYATNPRGTTYSTTIAFTPPALVEPILNYSMVSDDYSVTLQKAANTVITVSGLPPGLKLVTTTAGTTATVQGRPTAPGIYRVTFTAKGPGSLVTTYLETLVVQALPKSAVGTFIGLVNLDTTLNSTTGGRIDFTVSSTGYYSLKITQLTKVLSATGYLTVSPFITPQLVATMNDGSAVVLTLDATNTFTGTLTRSSVTVNLLGWRKTYDKTLNPSSAAAGYYTLGLRLDAAHAGVSTIPQGSGYVSAKIGTDGSCTFSGRAGDGSVLLTSGPLGPNGELLLYRQLYGKLGSLIGLLALTEDSGGSFLENKIAAPAYWTKPATTGRAYNASFTAVQVNVFGKYMARASTGSVVLGLPSTTDPSTLDFTEGGLSLALMNPDLVNLVTYFTSPLKAVVPLAGSATNLARVSLTINSASGAVSGSFTLVDGVLKRNVPYQGMLVRTADGSTTATGYFLLPQIPVGLQTINNSPILSGRWDLVP